MLDIRLKNVYDALHVRAQSSILCFPPKFSHLMLQVHDFEQAARFTLSQTQNDLHNPFYKYFEEMLRQGAQLLQVHDLSLLLTAVDNSAISSVLS